jgi:hypothetical protein
MLTVDYCQPTVGLPCPKCAGITTSLTRFVYQDNRAYALVYFRFVSPHPHHLVHAVVSLGELSKVEIPQCRVAFAIDLWNAPEEYRMQTVDPTGSPWKDLVLLGRFLSRDEAVAHPWLPEVWSVCDMLVSKDAALRVGLGAPANNGAA